MESKQQKSHQGIGEEIGGAIGKEVGAEIGKQVESHFQKKKDGAVRRAAKSKASRRIGYVFVIAFSLIFLWIINNFQAWDWIFITDEWSQVDQVVRYSIYLNIIVNAVFVFMDGRLLYFVGRLVTDGFGIYVSVRMFQVFPFNFKNLFGGWEWANAVFPWLIILGIVGIGIAIVVRTVRLMSGKNIYD